jgi:hypothetical protein
MNRPGIFAVLAITILTLTPGRALATRVEIAAGAWQQNPWGSIAYTYNVLDLLQDEIEDATGDLIPMDDAFLHQAFYRAHNLYDRFFPGIAPDDVVDSLLTRTDKLDFEDDCGFEPVLRPSGRIRVLIRPLVNFSFMATPLRFEGTGTLGTPFTFLDTLFEPSTAFRSRLKLSHYDVAWFAGYPRIPLGSAWHLHTETGINLRMVYFHASISQPTTGIAESISSTLPLPMLYLGAQLVHGGGFAVEAEARGTRYRDDYAYDIIGRIRHPIGGPLHLAAGYRHLYVDLDIDHIDAQGTFSGPFMETVLSF